MEKGAPEQAMEASCGSYASGPGLPSHSALWARWIAAAARPETEEQGVRNRGVSSQWHNLMRPCTTDHTDTLCPAAHTRRHAGTQTHTRAHTTDTRRRTDTQRHRMLHVIAAMGRDTSVPSARVVASAIPAPHLHSRVRDSGGGSRCAS